MRGLAAVALAVACARAAGGDVASAPTPASRDRLRVERAQVETRYAERERGCRARFAVSGCLQAAAGSRREALTRLRRQEIDLDDVERRDQAAARRARLDARVGAAPAAATPMPAAEAARSAPRRGRALPTTTGDAAAPVPGDSAPESLDATAFPRTPRPARSPHAPTPLHAPRPAVDRSARDADERAAFERKQQQAAAHRIAVERRNAELAGSGRPAAAPLPLPDVLRR